MIVEVGILFSGTVTRWSPRSARGDPQQARVDASIELFWGAAEMPGVPTWDQLFGTDGAAITGRQGDEQWRSYWLYGREVSQATVWRNMAYDKTLFDETFSEGWGTAEDRFRNAMAEGFGEAAEVLEEMIAVPPADQDMRVDPEGSTYMLGQREAAVRLRRQWLVSLFDGGEIEPMEDVLEDVLDEARHG